MEYLGFDRYSGSVYEGTPNGGYRVMPPPMLAPIRFFRGKDLQPIAPRGDGLPSEVFREDSFDAVTKLRRGRVFSQLAAEEWRVNDPHAQTLQSVKWANGTAQLIRLQTFCRSVLSDLSKQTVGRLPTVALGWEPHITFWRIVSIECNLVGTPMLTLRAKHSLGDTPELIEAKVPPEERDRLRSAMEGVEGSVNRLGPLDVIDRCRAVLAIAFAHRAGDQTKDLADAIKECLRKEFFREDSILSQCGQIVARLHSRGKSAEQAKRGVRPPSEADSDLALHCLRTVLVEFGWAQ